MQLILGLGWVSEQLLNDTSAQLGYTVPFTSVYAGKHVTEDKLRTDTLQKLNTTQKKQKQRKIQQNKTSLVLGLVISYDTRPGNKVGLFYKGPELTRG